MWNFMNFVRPEDIYAGTFFITLMLAASLYPIMTIIIHLLSSVRDWLYDEQETDTYTMTKFVRKFQKEDPYMGSDERWQKGWAYSTLFVLGIVFYYIGVLFILVYLIMYTLRATIRIHGALKKHIADKKAHK